MKKSFSFFEFIIVIAIIALLAVVTITNFSRASAIAKCREKGKSTTECKAEYLKKVEKKVIKEKETPSDWEKDSRRYR